MNCKKKIGPLYKICYRLTALKVKYFSKQRVRQLLFWRIFKKKLFFSVCQTFFSVIAEQLEHIKKLDTEKHISKVNKIKEHEQEKRNAFFYRGKLRHFHKEILFTKVIRLKIDRKNEIKNKPEHSDGKNVRVAFIESERKRYVFGYCIFQEHSLFVFIRILAFVFRVKCSHHIFFLSFVYHMLSNFWLMFSTVSFFLPLPKHKNVRKWESFPFRFVCTRIVVQWIYVHRTLNSEHRENEL